MHGPARFKNVRSDLRAARRFCSRFGPIWVKRWWGGQQLGSFFNRRWAAIALPPAPGAAVFSTLRGERKKKEEKKKKKKKKKKLRSPNAKQTPRRPGVAGGCDRANDIAARGLAGACRQNLAIAKNSASGGGGFENRKAGGAHQRKWCGGAHYSFGRVSRTLINAHDFFNRVCPRATFRQAGLRKKKFAFRLSFAAAGTRCEKQSVAGQLTIFVSWPQAGS